MLACVRATRTSLLRALDYVPKATGSLPPRGGLRVGGGRLLTYTRTSLGRAVRTAYRGTAGEEEGQEGEELTLTLTLTPQAKKKAKKEKKRKVVANDDEDEGLAL